MTKWLLAAALWLPAAAVNPSNWGDGCARMPLAVFEAALPNSVQRYPLTPTLGQSVIDSWARIDPLAIAGQSSSVTIYAVADRPLLITVHAAGCLLAVTPMKRKALWRLLRQHGGQLV